MKLTWVMKEPEDRLAKLCLCSNPDNPILTLYWGEVWGYGEGFTISGGIGSTYYSHEPIDANSIDEAKAKTEIWLAEKAKEQLAYHMRSIDFYKELLEDLPKVQNREF